MPDRDQPLPRLLDDYYCEQKALAAKVNRLPVGAALSDCACYTAKAKPLGLLKRKRKTEAPSPLVFIPKLLTDPPKP